MNANGSTYIYTAPDDLAEAIEYSEEVCRMPEALAAYRAAAPGQSIAHRAICDYLYPPVILDIVVDPDTTAAGRRIRIWAYDDTKILDLSLRILDAADEELEHGCAHETGGWWEYHVAPEAAARMAVIEAGAFDMAGNFTDKVQPVAQTGRGTEVLRG